MKKIKNLCLIAIVLLCSGCEKSSSPNSSSSSGNSNGNFICTEVVDELTKQPIEFALLEYYSLGMASGSITATGMTNAQGKFCCNAGNAIAVKVQASGYMSVPNGSLTKVMMERLSYLAIHVRNDAPAQATDKVIISFIDPIQFTNSELYLPGLIDSVYVIAVHPEVPVDWMSYNASTVTAQGSFTVQPSDTLAVDLFY